MEGVCVVEREPLLDGPLGEAEQQARSAGAAASGVGQRGPTSEPLGGVQGSPPFQTVDPTAVRAMYRRVGIDPTKTRPSSEALLRRVTRGEPLPRINSLVDICNWCSLAFQLPYGLYDVDHISGDVELRLGREGEQYVGIRKDVVHLAGRLTLADASGPFGNPTSDSARTMVTTETHRALFVVFSPKGLASRVPDVLDRTSERVVRFCGGREASRAVL
jgi:DNA/RNA-binding domain of Phe-tRNA-synthetase-like protein